MKPDYSHAGTVQADMEEVLLPFRATSGFIHAVYRPSFAFYSAETASREAIEESAEAYLRFLKGLK